MNNETEREEKLLVDTEQTRLLEKMIKRQESDIMLSRITAFAECALLAVLVIAFGLLIPRFLSTVKHVESSMEEVDALVAQADEAIGEIRVFVGNANEAMSEAMELADQAEEAMSEAVELVEHADTFIVENDEAVSQAIANFNSVDFESLNSSIVNLEKMIAKVKEVTPALVESLTPLMAFLKGMSE